MATLVFVALAAIAVVIVAVTVLMPRMVNARRRRLRALPFPQRWVAILHQSVPVYGRLPPQLKSQLHQHIQVFLAEKNFYGCGGLSVTDEIRLSIAAQACLLILNRETDYFAGLGSILVYPSAFLVNHESRDDAGVHTARERVLSGESWETGRVILAWDEVERGAASERDGYNLVLHEFAHQLDQESGCADGAPLLDDPLKYREWASTFAREYEALRENSRVGRAVILDEYGAHSPGEFFAVATETFFEKPRAMAREHPQLYAQLRDYFKVDPSSWPG